MVTTDKTNAKVLVDRFVSRFSEPYRYLLYHAALPLVLTPELLHYIRNSFLRGQVDWIAEVDLLLSDLCHKVGYELYAIDTSVRAYCLDEMNKEEMRKRFGQKRMQEVASLLIKYLKSLSQNNSISNQELRSQKWAALVYLDNKHKREVVNEIAATFINYIKPSTNNTEPNLSIINQDELYQLSLITKELAPQLDIYPEIIKFAEETYNILSSSSKTANTKLNAINQLLAINPNIINDSLVISTSLFNFETVKVDANGKIIKRLNKQAKQFTEDLGNGVLLEMVEIPGGTFMMGSPKDEGYDREKPQHKVTVPALYIGKYQVTQAQWKAIMGNNPSSFTGDDNLPVEQVSWNDAVEFCKKLSERTKKTYRLPSEAEWEYACRAGTTTVFAFGETITPDIVNYDGDRPYGEAPKGEYRDKTIPVGSLGVANDFGLYDMHGNVWEWCQDHWHSNYEGAPTDGSAWETLSSNNTGRVLRGGSYLSYAFNCRCAFRLYYAPVNRVISYGFRVVMIAQTLK